MTCAFVTGLSGPVLTDAERRFLAAAAPWGLILFRRNVVDRDQIRRLTDDFRTAVGWNAPVLIDQEGGRVQRMGPPHWRKYPSAARLAGAVALSGDVSLVRDAARVIAADLAEVGITIDCAPCLDFRVAGTTDAIGDRSYGGDAHLVAACGRAMAEGLLDGGVMPVIKHIPGHGRAIVDSHHALPVVGAAIDELEALDFAPFVALSDLPAAMTCHLLFTAVDPVNPATQSRIVIDEIIRGLIGFEGLLFTDDMSMSALSGSLGERTDRALKAGCDIALHCNGVMAEMEDVAAAAPELGGRALERADAALRTLRTPARVDIEAMVRRVETAVAAFDAGASI